METNKEGLNQIPLDKLLNKLIKAENQVSSLGNQISTNNVGWNDETSEKLSSAINKSHILGDYFDYRVNEDPDAAKELRKALKDKLKELNANYRWVLPTDETEIIENKRRHLQESLRKQSRTK